LAGFEVSTDGRFSGVHRRRGANTINASLRVATLIAAYSVYIGKERVEGCGKNIEILAIPKNDNFFFVSDDNAIRKLEVCFEAYEDAERRQFWDSIGATFTPSPIGHPSMSAITKELLSIDPYLPRIRKLSGDLQIGVSK
jgi:hypothetical protein